VGQIGFAYAGAVVAYCYADCVFNDRGAEPDGGSAGGIADGVVDDVFKRPDGKAFIRGNV
jgi:hypothetical protein